MEMFIRIKILVVGAFAWLTTSLGNLAVPLYLLIALMLADYFTAIKAAKYRGQVIDSSKSVKGIEKKILMLVLVLLGGVADVFLIYMGATVGINMLLITPIAIVVALWLIINEIISVLENIKDILGENAPSFLAIFLDNLKSKAEENLDLSEKLTIIAEAEESC